MGSYENSLDPISQKSKDIIKRNPDIIEVGFQNDIRPYLAISNCLVLPSYREGFPNVVLQALSIELPCIVTNINGCNEVVKDNVNGLIVEPKSKEDLYNAMKKLLIDKNLIDRLILNTRENIVKKYDRKEFFKYLLNEYNEMLNA